MANEFTNANRTYFDKTAANYESQPWQQKMTNHLFESLQNNLDFIGVDWIKNDGDIRQVRLLDYACGTGRVSKALRPYITHAIGLDISSKMVEQFNKQRSEDKIPSQACRAMQGDLMTPEPPLELCSDPVFYDFDIAAVGYGFHHFENPSLAVERLAERLKPGGVVLIIDFTAETFAKVGDGDQDAVGQSHGHHHGHGHKHGSLRAGDTIKTHGFSEQDMREIFEKAGLQKVAYKEMDELVEMRVDNKTPVLQRVFLGRAEKPT